MTDLICHREERKRRGDPGLIFWIATLEDSLAMTRKIYCRVPRLVRNDAENKLSHRNTRGFNLSSRGALATWWSRIDFLDCRARRLARNDKEDILPRAKTRSQ